MCNYTNFLICILSKNDASELMEFRRLLGRDHKTFELCLKTLSYLLSVKSDEVPLDSKNSYSICDYFNGELPSRMVNILNDSHGRDMERVILEVAGLLEVNVSVGLQPILSKLHLEVSSKEFYSRTVVLLLNLTKAAVRRFRNSFGSEDNLKFEEEDWKSFESVQEWKERVLENNVAFTLCKLAIAMCIFGTDEGRLFESFTEFPGSVLSLFPNELWIYVLGSFPVLCFDSKYLFSIRALGKYVTSISEKSYELIQNLISCQNFSIYLYDQVENFSTDTDHTLNILVMSNWIDYMYKYAQNKIKICNNRGKMECTIIRNWLSRLLSNNLVLAIIYAVFKYNYHMCINTLIKLAQVNDNIVFLQHIMFKSELNVNMMLGILSRVDLSVISKDPLSVSSIINYITQGFKSEEMIQYYRVWKKYLKEYDQIKHNREVVDGLLEVMLDYLVNTCYEEMEFPPEVFRSDVRRADVRERRFMEERKEALIKRNMFKRLVDILGFQKHKKKLIKSIELGCATVKKHRYVNEDLARIEFAMFLIYSLKLQSRYGEIYDVSVSNGYMLFYKYLGRMRSYMRERSEHDCDDLELEEEYHSYLTFYYANKIMEQNNKEAVYFLNNYVVARESEEGSAWYCKMRMVNYALESFILKHVETLLQNVMDMFQDNNGRNMNSFKMYLKYTSLYLRVYECLHNTNATQRINREGQNVDSLMDKYFKFYNKIVVKAMGIVVKNPYLASRYPDVLKVPFLFDTAQFFKILELSKDLTVEFLEILHRIFKYLGDEYIEPMTNLVIDLTKRMTCEVEWRASQLVVFEKLMMVVMELVKETKYLNPLMNCSEGAETIKKILVVSNKLSMQQELKMATNKMNLTIIEVLLNLSDKGDIVEKTTLRNQEFAKKELERLLTSACGTFEIKDQKSENRIVLGVLSVMDLLIYQSFTQIFGERRINERIRRCNSKEKKEDELENKESDKNGNKNENKESNKENVKENELKKGIKRENVSNIRDSKDYNKEKEKVLLSDHLYDWNLVNKECVYSLEFIAKMYLGFHTLPQTKLFLISEYFFFHGAAASNMEINEIKKRFLSENNEVRAESTILIYEFYKAKQKKSYK